ncbi:RHS repeat domain-containing protein, partial [Elizabethkingia anophelis]
QANADGEVYRYTTSTSWSNNATVSVLGLSGTYGANSLYKNVVTDEDGNSTIEFKNGQGQTVLVRKKNGSEDLDTYYVYNEYNQLAFVIPPLAVHKGVDLALLNELAYQYRYDGQNKLVEKKLPGKDWEYMVYDQQDRLVLTQDGKLRQLNKWLFTKYDKFGRVAYTGLLDSAPGRDAQQSNMVHFGGNNEERSASGFTQNGTTVYYSSSAYPVANFTLLTVNYYDEYPPGSPAVFNGASVLGSVPVNGRSTKGLPVASMVKNIEDNGWTKSYTWYDDKARPVATESRNHLGGYTRTSSVLAFSGVPTSTTTYHKRDAASGEMVMKEDFSYDHQNRLVKHTHQVNGGPVEILTENIYNELGQLESRNIGNGIQSIKNEYNIRGALTKMNDPKNLLNKLFGFELKYINPSGTSKKYNGNIAETDWATQSDGTLRRYSYQYDGVNRLKEGNYWDNAGAISGSYAERLNYDLNGNITGLQRTGQGAGVMDQLSYTYDQSGNSNKLIRVNDASGNAAGYPVGGNTIAYDINGNMVNHLDKGISNIAYNYLNLPSSITASMGNTDYVYRADGTKVRKVFGGKTTDYLDGFQYENGVLQFVPTSEGYYDVVKNKYIYNYTDHLGNVRLSYTKGASGGAEIIEENNYYPFGLKHQGYNSNSLASNAYQYKYNGKELQETGMYDYGARSYIPDIGRWMSPDPLSEEYRRWSPYNYAVNNPVRFTDPDGMSVYDIIGATKQDAQKFKADVHKVLSDSKFAAVRGLIDVKGKEFNKVDAKALSNALSGVTVSKDEQAYIDTVVNAINDSKVHTVEYLSLGDTVSSAGGTALKDHMNKAQAGVGDAMVPDASNVKADLINALGGEGFNVPSAKGSHSIIVETASTTPESRAETSSHEVLGHGIPSAKGASNTVNNTNAIRMSNLVRRVTGSTQPPRDGTNPPHAGGKVTNENDLPMSR